MGWENPPVPWREFEQRLSWRSRPRPVTRLPTGPGDPGSAGPDPGEPRGAGTDLDRPQWAELHCHSSYSFLDGASSPADLVAESGRLGLAALAITDHDGMYGTAQFAQAAARLQPGTGTRLRTVFGAELSLGLAAQPAAGRGGRSRMTSRPGLPDPEGEHLLVLARDPEGYRRLCQVISAAQLAGGEKGRPCYDTRTLADAQDGHWVVLTGCRKGAVPAALAAAGPAAAATALRALTDIFGAANVMGKVPSHAEPGADEPNDVLYELALSAGIGLVATGNVHYAAPQQARLAQVLASVRARRSLDEMDGWLAASGGAYLRSGAEMAQRLRRYPGVPERTVELALECAFDFQVIAPELPNFPVPGGHTEAAWLRTLVAEKAPARYGPPTAERVPGAYRQIARELDVIEGLGFPGYFLIVPDIVRFCEEAGILCQGRGSAANSAVCFAMGITSVDPVKHQLLFERFLSAGRDGPPDIQDEVGYLSDAVISEVAERIGITELDVRNVASYYSMLRFKPAGKFNVQVCTNISCMLRGGYELYERFQKELGIGDKGVTSDGLFSLEEVECIGACCWAPAIQVNYEFHEELSPNHVPGILAGYRGRTQSEGAKPNA